MMNMERKSWPWRKKLEKNTSLLTPASPSPPPPQHIESSSDPLQPPRPTPIPASSSLSLLPSTHQISPIQQDHQLQQLQQKKRPSPVAIDDDVIRSGLHGVDAEETVKMLTQRIVDLSSRLVAKDELANQQAGVAKEAGADLMNKDEQLRQHLVALKEEKAARDKAEAGYLSIKQELDKVCRQKGSLEAQMVQLDGALKECMDKMRHAKDQLEHKSQEATFRKREWDKLRGDLETESAHLKRQLMEAMAENIAVSKSHQERARSLAEINESKSKAESESKILQVQIESLHKDMDAYKYEVHLLKKELQISNDEREHNKKVADATHKQHLESVKKIAKLDSECNRLRSLVRKKSPGPAAIAQMRVEADHVGKKRLPSPKISSASSLDQKELEALSDRLISMEDETKLLKEALAKKTAELQSARQLCARTVSKLSSAEKILEAMAKGQAVPPLSIEEHRAIVRIIKSDSVSQQQAFALPPASPNAGCESMEVMDWVLSSEDGNNNDDELSNAESWASALIAELSHLKKDDGFSATKIDESSKPPIIINLLQDFDLQGALQELNSKLSCIGENILALPSSLRSVGEQGKGNESRSLQFGVLSQIMEEFTLVKQRLVEVGKAMELERNEMQVMEVDRSVQGSELSRMDGRVVVDECDEEVKLPVENDTEKRTFVGAVRKVMEALLVLVESNKQGETEDGTEDEKALLDCLQTAVNVLDGGRVLQYLSENSAAQVLCNIGDVLKVQYGVADPRNASTMEGHTNASSMVAAVAEDGDGSVGEIVSGNNSVDEVIFSSCSSNGEVVAGGKPFDGVIFGDISVGKISVGAIENMGNISVGVSGPGKDSCRGEDKIEEANVKLLTKNCELTLELEILQHEVERLSTERDEIDVKLVAAREELEKQRARVATLETESLQLAQDKASLANELSDTSSRKHNLEEDLADARASLDDLRQQVSTLTSELADQAAQLQGFTSLRDVGTPGRGRKTNGGDADGKAKKEREIACAKAQLAECQRTIIVLGNQLRAISSVQDHVAAEASFDSSLESATSTDQMNLPPLVKFDGDGSVGSVQVVGRNARLRRAPPAYVRTRGGKLVCADQYWGSAGDIPLSGSEHQGTPSHPAACYSFGSRHVPLPRHLYSAVCSQSPLHEYVTEHMYSPPETALSSPAGSPARLSIHVERVRKAPPVNGSPGTTSLSKSMNKAVVDTGAASSPSPSPAARKAASASRIARFFSRAKNQR